MVMFFIVLLVFGSANGNLQPNQTGDLSATDMFNINPSTCGLSEEEFIAVADCITDIMMFYDQQQNITKSRYEYERTCHIGCMAYTPEDCEAHRADVMHVTRRKRKITTRKPWPTTIHYTVDPAYTAIQLGRIKDALQFWEDNTCLTFVEGFPPNPGPEAGFLRILANDSGCWSFVGNLGRVEGQIVNLNKKGGCASNVGIPLHELGHALGMYHEMIRPDRDDYITVNLDNVLPPGVAQYEIVLMSDTHGVPYDWASVMHYEVGSFSSGGPTMATKGMYGPYYDRMMGQRFTASYFDVAVVNKRVCEIDNGVCASATVSCLANGHPDPRDCSACKCVEGLSGTTCDQADVANSDASCQSVTAVITVDSLTETCLSHPTGPGVKACHWYLQTAPSCTIDIRIDTADTPFNLRSTTSTYVSGGVDTYIMCTNWLEIRTGNVGVRGLRLCGSDPVTDTLTSSSNDAVISFQQNKDNADTFKVCYKQTSAICSNGDPCANIDCGDNGNCTDGACLCVNRYTGSLCQNAPSSDDICGFKLYPDQSPMDTGESVSVTSYQQCWQACFDDVTCMSFVWNQGTNTCEKFIISFKNLQSTPNQHYNVYFCGCPSSAEMST